MMKHFSIFHWLSYVAIFWFSPGLVAQTMTNSANLTIQSGLEVTVQGELLNSGSGEIALDGELSVIGNITNNSSTSLTTGNGTFKLTGTTLQTIGGSQASRFPDLTQSNSAGVNLDQSIQVDGVLDLDNGGIDQSTHNIDLGTTGSIANESNTKRIQGTSGKITAVRDLNAPSGLDVAGMGVIITSGANWGSTTIERGHEAMMVGSGNSVFRNFDINPANNSGLDATLRINYFDDELNGQNPLTLNQWRLSSGATDWTPGNVPNKGQPNFVEGGPYDVMGLWTLSADGTSSIGDLLPRLSVRFYPNPLANGSQLHIEGLEQGEYTLILSDMRGRSVWQHKEKIFVPNVQSFHLPNLAEGVYSLQITSDKYASSVGRIQIKQ